MRNAYEARVYKLVKEGSLSGSKQPTIREVTGTKLRRPAIVRQRNGENYTQAVRRHYGTMVPAYQDAKCMLFCECQSKGHSRRMLQAFYGLTLSEIADQPCEAVSSHA